MNRCKWCGLTPDKHAGQAHGFRAEDEPQTVAVKRQDLERWLEWNRAEAREADRNGMNGRWHDLKKFIVAIESYLKGSP